MDYMAGLNEGQKQAVLSDKKYVRIIAGAGSGKTRVLTTRIVHLISHHQIAPWKICAITFTNKAANEMKTRIDRMLPEASRVHISTIHALCVRIIREEYEAAGLVRNFTILDSADQQAVLREAYKQFGIDRGELKVREVLDYIGNNKFSNISADQAMAMAWSAPREEKKAKVYGYYLKRLKEMFALDFDDLLLVVNNLLAHNASVLSKWQARFDVICVDEFQDVDHIQYQIVTALTGTHNQLYVVGDPDQTIYTWRGADVDFIVNFNQRYPDAETIILNQNYRSTQHILNCANALIGNNKNRHKKDLFANKQSDHQVVYASLADDEAESFWIAKTIESLHDEGQSYLDMAVLYRSNYLSRSLEKALQRRQIPYIIYGGLRFYDRAEIKDMMSYLRMITHGDDLALRRSIQSPRRGIGDKTLADIEMVAQSQGMTLYEGMRYQISLGMANAKIMKYVDLIETLRDLAVDASLEFLMNRVLELSGLRNHFEKNQEFERLEGIKELMGDAISFERNYEDASLEEYVQMISLYGDKDEVTEGEYVRLMTVHAAKGLEFETVFVMGLSDDVFPNKNSVLDSAGGIQEERRLAYVALTRAKDRLYLTNNNGFSFVASRYNIPSRFIKEMGLDALDTKDDTVSSLAQKSRISFESKPLALNPVRFKLSDIVVHDNFGEGVVIRVDEDNLKIAFNFPFGTKIISRKYFGLRPKGDLS